MQATRIRAPYRQAFPVPSERLECIHNKGCDREDQHPEGDELEQAALRQLAQGEAAADEHECHDDPDALEEDVSQIDVLSCHSGC